MRQMGIYRLDPPLVPVVAAPAALELEAGDALEVHHLEHLLGLGVDLDDVLLEGGDVGHVVVPPLPLLLLQLDGDAAHRRPLQPLHEMRDEAGDLVAQRLRGDQGDLETDGNGQVTPKLTVYTVKVSAIRNGHLISSPNFGNRIVSMPIGPIRVINTQK